MFTSIFLTPVIAQRLLNFTPSQTGLLLLPGALIALVGLMVSGRLLQSGLSPVVIIAAGFWLLYLFQLAHVGHRSRYIAWLYYLVAYFQCIGDGVFNGAFNSIGGIILKTYRYPARRGVE